MHASYIDMYLTDVSIKIIAHIRLSKPLKEFPFYIMCQTATSTPSPSPSIISIEYNPTRQSILNYSYNLFLENIPGMNVRT